MIDEGKRSSQTEINQIPDALIADPIVFRGLSDKELVGLGLMGVVIWTPISILLLWPFGVPAFGLALGLALALGTLVVSGHWLARLKRRMPNGLHVIFIKSRLHRRGIANFGYINRSGAWDIRRTRAVEVSTDQDGQL